MRTCADLLAVTVAPGQTGPVPPGAGLFGSGTHELHFPGGTVWTAFLGPEPAEIRATGYRTAEERADRRPAAYALSLGIRDVRDGHPLGTAALAHRLRTGDELHLIAAPFAAVVVHGERVYAAADFLGLRHLYAVARPGWAAVSTSARLLARIAGADLDPTALGGYRITGFHLGLDTPFAGVTKLPAGARWQLAGGVISTLPGEPPAVAWAGEPRAVAPSNLPSPADAARLLGESINGCLDAHPRTVFELSGGLDSRLTLAALPVGRRAGVRALTLAAPGSADAAVARRIAARYRLDHQVVDLGRLADLTPADAYRLVHRAAVRHDATGNPVALGVLDWAEARVEPGVRINGQGGELARGFYFGEPRGPVTPDKVDRFFRWWFTANDAVPGYCLAPEFARRSQAEVRDRLRAIFSRYHADWLSATDEFYLRERIHRWVGINYTGACLQRVIVSPFLDPRFVALARALPPEVKRSSGFAARVLEALDPELARLRLASGLRPVTFPRRLAEYTVRGVVLGVGRKLAQRVVPSNRPPAGAALLAQLVVRHWRANPQLLDATAKSGLVREEWLAGMLAGTQSAGVAAVGFLANLEATQNTE